MRRIATGSVIVVLLFAAFLLTANSGNGCHGHCYSHGTPIAVPIANTDGNSSTNALDTNAVAGAFLGVQEQGQEVGEGPCRLGTLDDPIFEGSTVTLLGSAVLDEQQDRPLCLIDIMLAPGAQANSLVEIGEATTFYVREGNIEFTLDDNRNVGFVRVVPANEDERAKLEEAGWVNQGDGSYLVEGTGQSFTISAGASIYLDNEQPGEVALIYQNAGEGEEEAALLISSAPPVAEAEATPTE